MGGCNIKICFSRGELFFLHKLVSKSTILGLYFDKVKKQNFQMRFQLRLKSINRWCKSNFTCSEECVMLGTILP